MRREHIAMLVVVAAVLNVLAFVALDVRGTAGVSAWVAAGAAGVGIAGLVLMGVGRAMRIGSPPLPGARGTKSDPPAPGAAAADPGRSAAPAARPSQPADIAVIARDRDVLVTACIDVADAVHSEGLRERLVSALSTAGVVAIRSDGEAFDPGRQVGVDRVATTDPALHDRVATTELPGYVDRGTLLRRPHVTVYRDGGQER